VREINSRNVQGDVAELGVFQGYFAAAMNSHFADRRLFLFDTFAGFDERDIHGDRTRKTKSRPGDFTATNVATVMDRMPSPQQVVPVVGWFPESTNELTGDERFCLVSLDVDLYDPILAGLEWFYPRLSPGGYILVHDYNNNRYSGARLAVEEFSARASVVVVPLPDSGGTCVIGRPLS
jgi:O-methyltransferase